MGARTPFLWHEDKKRDSSFCGTMPCFLYVPTPAGQAAIEAEGGILFDHGYFVDMQPCGRLKLQSESKTIYLKQDGFLVNVSTREFAAGNFVIFYMFVCSYLAMGMAYRNETHLLLDHLKQADIYFLHIDVNFLKMFKLNVDSCPTPKLLERYLSNSSSLCNKVKGCITAHKMMTILYAHNCRHPALSTCFWPAYNFHKELASHSTAMFDKLRSLHNEDSSCDGPVEYLNFVIDTVDQSRKLHNETQSEADDFESATCKDGSLVFNFQDPDAFQKWRRKQVSDLRMNYTSSPTFALNVTEPVKPRKWERKTSKQYCAPPSNLTCPHPQSIRRPLMEDLKVGLPRDQFKALKALLKKGTTKHLVQLNHDIWYHRSKTREIAAKYESLILENMSETLHIEQVLSRVQTELSQEVKAVTREMRRACRALELIRVV